ncbi:LacI family DNA-binding transcriptional regulator [Paenibacillus sp. FSL F4-0122]|uniref:LacI family DNA-binding transcriptional regulator n=1 Tax=Paenibacillus TaxID=44249 RepID=UPI00096EE25A|nr:LacI family DNA-binding transcriptional regulator [Paenibacillus odorifer]OME44202.1 LacI family transcriptional regulator [Paenibacillus odorifer]OZQ77365.1 LacI family transcriptional regulator [Paenibacillus odorifer]
MTNIQEIARLAGVSTTTVSRVINQHPYVSETKRQKILEIIEHLDYVPNSSAKSLKKGMTRIIGVLTGTYTTLSTSFIQAFNTIAQKHGFNVMLFITNGDPQQELVALEMLRSKQLDALVCLFRTNEWNVIESYAKYGPIVTWQRLVSDTIPSVFMDQYQGYMLGLEYLYSKGYRRIANVFSSKGLNTPERIRAYNDFAAKYQIKSNDFPDFHYKLSIFDGEEVARWWIEQTNRPDAIACSNDNVAAGLLTELRRAGFTAPVDVGILGFDNSELAHLLDLTTIHYPANDQAENAFLIILDMLGQPAPKPRLLEFELIERKST